MQRRRHMGVVDLKAVDRSAVGERGVGGADLLGTTEQGGWTTAAQCNGGIGRDAAPWPGCPVKSTTNRIQSTKLKMGDDVVRHGRKLESGDPFAQPGCNSAGGWRVHREPY